MSARIHFFGGVTSVTGSNFLLDTGERKILVDCGLFQGKHSVEEENWQPFPFSPADISFLVVTHAHIDHVGRIPKLVKDGFRGTILSTEATRALAEPLLLDAMELVDRSAEHAKKQPLYERDDIAAAFKLWKGIAYHQPQDMGDGVTLELFDAGHILGSAMAQFRRGESRILFSGDLGGGNSPLLPPVESPLNLTYLLVESVYGDRMRPDDAHRKDLLENVIEDSIAKGGTLLIPAFSTERTQDLLFAIRSLMLEHRVPSTPVYLDSPLAEKITDAFLAYPNYFRPDIKERIEKGEKIFSFPELHFVHDARESAEICKHKGAKILLAGSGMSNGGRILAHEMELLPDPEATLLIVGYQSAGSLGRHLIEGAKSVEIHGTAVPVRCRIESMYGYSAHMDSEELLDFVNKASDSLTLKEVFVVMGEPASESFLAQRIRDFLGVRAIVPEPNSEAEIDF